MSITFEQLTSVFHNLLMDHFRATAPSSHNEPFLAFDLGTPTPDETFHLPPENPQYSPAAALEYLSLFANVAPQIRDGVFLMTSNTIEHLYEILLLGATPRDAANLELFGNIKNSARAAFDNTLGSSIPPGTGRFRPVQANPINWYDQSEAGNWTTLTISAADQPPPPEGGLRLDPRLFKWQLAPHELRPLLGTRASIQTVRNFQLARAAELAAAPPPAAAPPLQLATVHRFIDPNAAVIEIRHLFPLDKIVAADLERPPSPPVEPPVSSDNFSLSVEVCLVHLHRPWFSDSLMNIGEWFVPTIAKGAFSGGAGPEDPAPLSTLPIACIFIRNLSIKAQWSDTDQQNVENSSHLGSFALIGRTFDRNTATLTVPGMQSVAWICDPLPVLPPADPPA